MATLEKIRSKAGLLVAVVGLALFAFIIGDFLRSGSTFFHQRQEIVLNIDGKTVSVQDFQTKIAEMEEVYKMQTGNSSVPEEVQSQIRESVFESMVKEILMQEESSKVGFTVSKSELSDLIMGNNISPMIQQMPMFRNPQTGAFDKNALIQFLQTIESDDTQNQSPQMYQEIQRYKTFWSFFEKTIKQQKLEEKFSNIISKSIVANSLDAKAAFEDNKVSVDLDYVMQAYNTIPDDQVTVSEDEIAKLYNKRKALYKQSEAMMIDYIAVDITPSQDDFNKVLENMNKLKPELESSTPVSDVVNDNSDIPYSDVFVSANNLSAENKQFIETATIGNTQGPFLVNNTYHLIKLVDKTTAPDSVKVYQMTLPQLGDNELKNLTDSLINEINKGKTFSDVVKEATDGKSTGEMGWMTEATLLKSSDEKFKNEVFNAPVNKVFIAKSTYGTHLVQVTEKTAPVAKYKIADISVEVTASSETNKKLFNDLTQYVAKNKNLETFKSAAKDAGYVCYTDITIGKNDQTVGSVRNVRPLIRWAYDQKKGAISDIFDCQDKFVVVAVEGLIKEGYRSLASVSEPLKREIMNEKKGEKIIAGLKSKNFSTLEEYASFMASSVQSVKFVNFATNRISGIGNEPKITAEAPLAEVGKISAPISGNNGVFIVKVIDKKANENEFDLAAQKQMLNMNNSYRFMYQSMQILRDKSKIEDNRIRFY